MAKNEF